MANFAIGSELGLVDAYRHMAHQAPLALQQHEIADRVKTGKLRPEHAAQMNAQKTAIAETANSMIGRYISEGTFIPEDQQLVRERLPATKRQRLERLLDDPERDKSCNSPLSKDDQFLVRETLRYDEGLDPEIKKFAKKFKAREAEWGKTIDKIIEEQRNAEELANRYYDEFRIDAPVRQPNEAPSIIECYDEAPRQKRTALGVNEYMTSQDTVLMLDAVGQVDEDESIEEWHLRAHGVIADWRNIRSVPDAAELPGLEAQMSAEHENARLQEDERGMAQIEAQTATRIRNLRAARNTVPSPAVTQAAMARTLQRGRDREDRERKILNDDPARRRTLPPLSQEIQSISASPIPDSTGSSSPVSSHQASSRPRNHLLDRRDRARDPSRNSL